MRELESKSKYLILGMLARAPLTGYEIRSWIEHEYSHFWQASFGQIYPILKNLVQNGHAEVYGNPNGTDGRGQIRYRITDSGKEVLEAWLRVEPEIEKLRYEILLKISFGEHTETAVLLKHLDAFIRRNEANLVEMNDYIRRFEQYETPDPNPVYSRLTAMCGQYLYSAMRDWASKAKDILQKEVEQL